MSGILLVVFAVALLLAGLMRIFAEMNTRTLNIIVGILDIIIAVVIIFVFLTGGK